ncbi:MAG TPA: type II secretion system protein [Candidatus Omnitrophica bacterium]|nr:type II secretion system protein [Candidatus Omnitrophota bacterium]
MIFKKNFTLVETLVVVAIFSIIVAGIGLSFVSGMKLWGRIYNGEFFSADAFLTLEKMIKELQSKADTSFIKFEGQSQKISFPTLKGDRIIKVNYEFDSIQKVFIRKEIPLEDIIEEKEEDIEGRPIFFLDDFSLRYFYFDKDKEDYEWKESWEEEEGSFLGVEIKIKVKGEEFVKKVFF